jgi:hypothetical protein
LVIFKSKILNSLCDISVNSVSLDSALSCCVVLEEWCCTDMAASEPHSLSWWGTWDFLLWFLGAFSVWAGLLPERQLRTCKLYTLSKVHAVRSLPPSPKFIQMSLSIVHCAWPFPSTQAVLCLWSSQNPYWFARATLSLNCSFAWLVELGRSLVVGSRREKQNKDRNNNHNKQIKAKSVLLHCRLVFKTSLR